MMFTHGEDIFTDEPNEPVEVGEDKIEEELGKFSDKETIDQCYICYEKEGSSNKQCNHCSSEYCTECIKKWIVTQLENGISETKCPNCRQ